MTEETSGQDDAGHEVPFVAIGAGERAPWADLDLNCPRCGEGPLPLHDSKNGLLSFIYHCGQSWARGDIRW
ncbi:hypothetical protein ACFFVI_16545 [Kineococcus gynurae]|uniref:Uncharacterized protein n=1 Tax=Kineococcus gynurae TaxID=452979 RepID=A0ABV5LWV2_9ACTN